MNDNWKEAQGLGIFEGFDGRPDLFIDANKMIWVRRGTPSHEAIFMMEAKIKQLDEKNEELTYDVEHLEGRLRTNELLDVEVLRREIIKLHEALRLSKEKHP